MADQQAPLIPEEAPQRVPILLTLADITAWDIGPGKDSDCVLKMSVLVRGFEDTKLIRALAGGRVVLRILPLQMSLPGSDPETAEGCLHTGLKLNFGSISGKRMEVCMTCGQVLEVAQDDAPAAPEGQEGPPPEAPTDGV